YYPTIDNDNNFSYKYNVIKDAGNKKLSKKESKSHIRVVAVKITNTTGKTLKYGHNFKIFSGNKEASLYNPASTAKLVKQTAPAYLFYLLLTPLKFYSNDGVKTTYTPVGFVLGPGLAFGNLAVAATANKRFR